MRFAALRFALCPPQKETKLLKNGANLISILKNIDIKKFILFVSPANLLFYEDRRISAYIFFAHPIRFSLDIYVVSAFGSILPCFFKVLFRLFLTGCFSAFNSPAFSLPRMSMYMMTGCRLSASKMARASMFQMPRAPLHYIQSVESPCLCHCRTPASSSSTPRPGSSGFSA